MRDTGGTGRSRLPLANAGRAGTLAEAPAVVSSRGAWPTRSTWTCTLGVKPSSTGISSVCEPPATVKRSSRRRPLRRRVRIPSAGAKGDSTRIFATSPARYSFRSGTSVTFSSSRSRAGGHARRRPPRPAAAVSFSRPRSSATRATTRQAPPSFASKRARTGSPADSSALLLRVLRDLLPLALDLLPVEPLGAQAHRAARDRAALEVGRDRVDHDGLALLHEGPLRAQAHVDAPTDGRGGPPRRSTPAGSRP